MSEVPMYSKARTLSNPYFLSHHWVEVVKETSGGRVPRPPNQTPRPPNQERIASGRYGGLHQDGTVARPEQTARACSVLPPRSAVLTPHAPSPCPPGTASEIGCSRDDAPPPLPPPTTGPAPDSAAARTTTERECVKERERERVKVWERERECVRECVYGRESARRECVR